MTLHLALWHIVPALCTSAAAAVDQGLSCKWWSLRCIQATTWARNTSCSGDRVLSSFTQNVWLVGLDECRPRHMNRAFTSHRSPLSMSISRDSIQIASSFSFRLCCCDCCALPSCRIFLHLSRTFPSRTLRPPSQTSVSPETIPGPSLISPAFSSGPRSEPGLSSGWPSVHRNTLQIITSFYLRLFHVC